MTKNIKRCIIVALERFHEDFPLPYYLEDSDTAIELANLASIAYVCDTMDRLPSNIGYKDVVSVYNDVHGTDISSEREDNPF